MKKLFAMLLALVMTMGLMACGAQPTAANDTDGDAGRGQCQPAHDQALF